MKIAVVGCGISGLGAAYYLAKQHEVTVFEKEDYPGGHTNTIMVEEDGKKLPVDTGFIVFNDKTYPNLNRFFDELGISAKNTDMSFSVYNKMTGLQWNGGNLSGLFAQKRNLFNIKYLRLLWQAKNFFQKAPETTKGIDYSCSMGEYLDTYKYGTYFRENFILPMGSAVWSTPPGKMLSFPALTLIQFFKNHGFLDVSQTVQWKSVQNGSKSYVEKALANSKIELKLKEPVASVEKVKENLCKLTTEKREYQFDKVIFACHAPTTVKIFKSITQEQKQVLDKFQYEKNIAILHSDESSMPTRRKAWACWNFKMYPGERTSTVYWMNRLQNLDYQKNYFVSINEHDELDPAKVIRTIEYEHPLFDTDAMQNQAALQQLNQDGTVFFAGAYFRYGFHEDGISSGLEVVRRLQGE
ncbi:MAG: FAD-dependent oxidoreductase [Spirochaetota bacterium]